MDIQVLQPGMSEGFFGQKVSFYEDPWERLYSALGTGAILQGRVSGVERDGSLVVFVGKVKGIIPKDEIGGLHQRPADLLGVGVMFKVKHCDRANGVVYLSRREALDEMGARTWKDLEETCGELVALQEQLTAKREAGAPVAEVREITEKMRSVGPVRVATVRVVYPESAFVDIGGVDAYLPAHEISWSRVDDARAFLVPGQSFDVRVIQVDFANKKVKVSIRALLPDPWLMAEERYKRGGLYRGEVRGVSARGNLVVELDDPGVIAVCRLLPLNNPERGEKVMVRVHAVNPARRYIKGSIAGRQRAAG